MGYIHLTVNECAKIEILLKEGLSIRAIVISMIGSKHSRMLDSFCSTYLKISERIINP